MDKFTWSAFCRVDVHHVDMCCSKVPASASVALVSEPNSYHGLLLEAMVFSRSDDRAALLHHRRSVLELSLPLAWLYCSVATSSPRSLQHVPQSNRTCCSVAHCSMPHHIVLAFVMYSLCTVLSLTTARRDGFEFSYCSLLLQAGVRRHARSTARPYKKVPTDVKTSRTAQMGTPGTFNAAVFCAC